MKEGKFYVYVAYGVNQEVLYVGKGTGSRYKHCLNGASNCREINQYYFQNGCDGSITVEILNRFSTNDEALSFERCKIIELLPLFNKDHNPARTTRRTFENKIQLPILERLQNGNVVDFSKLMKVYIKAIQDEDIGVVEMVEQRSEIHKQYVEILSIDKIKSIGFNKTKLTNAYNLAIKFSNSNIEIKSYLSSIRVGGKYTSSFIVKRLQEAYDKVGVERKATSNDIKNYFSVIKTQVVGEDGNRKQGFKIVSDLYCSNIYSDDS